MRLGTFLSSSGEHVGAWRHHDTPSQTRASFGQYLQSAKVAEESLFDLILLGDVSPSNDSPVETLMYNAAVERLDPFMLISALAVTTKNIGLVPTGSASFEQPYHIARRIASLDHLSEGRGGWNCVTTSNASMALNFNQESHLPPEQRYARAEEFVDIVMGLWDSWDDDAFIREKASGIYFHADGLHVLNHKGPHFKVRGPLDHIRSRQGRPVVVQAGSSEAGRELGARTADVVFTTHQNLSSAQSFYADIKERAARFGRDPDQVLVLVALMPVIGADKKVAQDKLDELDCLIPQSVAISRLAEYLGGIDLSPYPPNEPVPHNLPEAKGIQSRRQSLIDLGQRDGLTLAQLAQKMAGTRGHWVVTGTSCDVADAMQDWFEGRGADGFLLVPPRTPFSLEQFRDSVIPELQGRELFRTAYEGQTLREHLGLHRPARGEISGGRQPRS
jgi:FMN-dependent oxidoreductase (nitrilotriacetate monooxygenase family)